jgi:integrase
MRIAARVNGKRFETVEIHGAGRRGRLIVPAGAGSFYAVYQGKQPKTGAWGKVVKPLGTDPTVAYVKYLDMAERDRQGLDPEAPAPIVVTRGDQANPLTRQVAWEHQVHTGTTWHEIFTAYQGEMRSHRLEGVLEESTVSRYMRSLNKFDTYLKIRGVDHAGSITSEFIEQFRKHRLEEGAKRAWVVDMRALNIVFNYAAKRKMIATNPVDVAEARKRMGKAGSNSKPFTPEEVVKLKKVLKDEEKLLFYLLLRTGMRASDIMDLRWSEVAKGRVIHMPKKTGRRTAAVVNIPMQPDLAEVIEAEREKRKPKPEDIVLLNFNTKSPYVWSRLYEHCQAIGRRAGITKVNPHRFRGRFVQDCQLLGCDISEVARLLGDTVKTVEKHYDFHTPERQAKTDAKLMAAAV